MSSPFFIFSLVFGLAVCAGLVARALRQPAFLGHVLVGLAVGYWGFMRGGEVNRLLEVLSSAGVMLLLFLVGLEMNVVEVKKMGGKAVLTGLGQITITTLIFCVFLIRFGLNWNSSLFLGISLAFSSTIIIVKLLSERHDLSSLVGKMAIALLLIQDLAAIVLLVVFGGGFSGGLVLLFVKILLLVGLTLLISRKMMPRILHRLARSMDELILFSLAWCFVLAAVIASPLLGLSLEIGGFLAGLALSGSFEHVQIATKIKPIRDFFLTIFFISLGLNIRLDHTVILFAVLLSAAVVFVKPMVVWFLMRLFGYKQRVSFGTGLMMGQISEFSFILVGVGAKVGFLSGSDVSLVSLVGLITMVVSGYLIIDKEKVFQVLMPILNSIWKDTSKPDPVFEELADHIILFGCHRMGRSVLMRLLESHEKILIVDFDPEVIARLKDEGAKVIYADAADVEIYDQLSLSSAKMVISTLRDIKDNLVMLSEINKRGSKVSVVVDAESIEDAERLYQAGATYVIFPHFVGGWHLGDLVRKGVHKKKDFESYRKYQQEVMAGVYE